MKALTYIAVTFFTLTSFQIRKLNPCEKMGMDYYIYSNKQTSCKKEFPEQLSFFFEQIGGYGDQSEVAQVSVILDIDLSVFQNYDYGTDNKEEEIQFWQNIDDFEKVIDDFLFKIDKNPDYFKLLKHNKNKEYYDSEMRRITKIKNQEKFIKELEKLQNKPDYLFPADYGYLSSGRIVTDLKTLKGVLTCYKKEGVTKIKLMYM